MATVYERFAGALTTAESETNTQLNYITENNSGAAVEAFKDSERAEISIHAHLQSLIPAARATAHAYSTAADLSTQAIATLDSLDQRYEEELTKCLYGQPVSREDAWVAATALIEKARAEMEAVESKTADEIKAAFDEITLPDSFAELMGHDEIAGHVDSRLKSEFNEIAKSDPDRAKRILQAMADRIAQEKGLPRIELNFQKEIKREGKALLGVGGYNPFLGGYFVQLDEDVLHGENFGGVQVDPWELIETTSHELEHCWQYSRNDPFSSVMSPEEVDRWNRLDQEHVRAKGYPYRPIEVDARRSGRDFINQMSYEEFMELCNQVP